MNIKKIAVVLITVIGFNINSWSQPDYSKIIFKSKIAEYKKKKPSLQGIDISKEQIKELITLLGSSYYSGNEIDGITEKVWLAFIDPKKFDFVFKDLAIRAIPNWNKKNARGQIVVEPNPFLAEWTLANSEIPYFHKACSMILSHYNLMAYSEDAKNTKKSLRKLLYTQRINFRSVSSNDWTNSYLHSANNAIKSKGLVALIADHGEYDFFICKIDKKEKLKVLLKKIDWDFVVP